MNEYKKSSEKKLTLLLLCWLFGLLGMHRFYTGKYITGGFYLLALLLIGVMSLSNIEIITAIPIGFLFLFWVVDVTRIIMGKFTDKEGMPIIDWI